MLIGSYEVISEVGRGGMGVVLRGRARDGREVAVKVMRPDIDRAALARFERERRLQAQLGAEEGFVPLLETGDGPQGPFLVMPLLKGGSLRDRIFSGPLQTDAALALARALASALAAAHARGLVHRDLKPENVLFSQDGRAFISDLGLAKHFDASAEGARGTVVISKTGIGLGTFGYAPLEQLNDGKHAGPCQDVFAFGAILYECLTGKPAFHGRTVPELLARLRDGKVDPIRRLRPDVPSVLAETVERALARDPAARWQDGAALVAALARPEPPSQANLATVELPAPVPARPRNGIEQGLTAAHAETVSRAPAPRHATEADAISLGDMETNLPAARAESDAALAPTHAAQEHTPPGSGRCPRCRATVEPEQPGGPCPVCTALADPRRRVGRFALLAELGRGGMGVVYKAWDCSLGRVLALKLLPQDADESSVARFAREAQAAGRLRHPSIVSVHDAGRVDGRPFIAMDYIEGKSLAARISSEPKLSLTRAVEIMRDVARAVHHAHAQGIFHRDLKPQNVMLGPGDHPYVLDFGLAVLRSSRTILTKEGTVLGTPAYMPPEQANAERPTDERSDVYSLGATLYHAITGKPPFSGANDIAVLTAVLSRDPPPPSRINRRALGDLDTICQKCLEKESERRYATAEELALDLDRYLSGEPIAARPLSFIGRVRRRIRRNMAASIVTSLALVVAFGSVGATSVRQWVVERRLADALERATSAASERAAGLRTEANAALAKLETALARGGDTVAGIPSAAALALAPIEDEAGLRGDLLSRAEVACQKDLEGPALEAIVAKALGSVGRGSLLARGARLSANAANALGRTKDATRERARAYRLDPEGTDGATAFLEIAEGLASRGDDRRALPLFARLASRPLPQAIAARADLGAARSALAVGEPALARDRARRALGREALEPAAKVTARDIEHFASRLAARPAPPLPIHSPIFVRPGGETGPVYVVGIASSPPSIRAYGLDPSGKEYVEVASAAIPAGAATVAPLRVPGGLSLALLQNDQDVKTFSFDGRKLEPGPAVAIRGWEGTRHFLAAGDLDGDGRDDLVIQVRRPGDKSFQPLAVLDPTGEPRVQVIPSPPYPVWRHQAAVVALDGGGKKQLVLARGKFAAFTVHVFEWTGPGGEPVERFSQPLGNPRHMLAVDEGGKQCAIGCFERDRDSDVRFDDEPDLGERFTTGIWRIARQRPEAPPSVEPLLAFPFADRYDRQIRLIAAGALPHDPESLLVRETMHKDGETQEQLLLARSGHGERLRVGFRKGDLLDHLVALVDLDGDGEPELVSGTEHDPLTIVGLRALEPPAEERFPDPSPSEATPLDVALDLVACGEPAEARAQLEAALARRDISAADRSRARIARARAFALEGRAAAARDLWLEVAKSEPELAHDALREAAALAEQAGIPGDAISDLERLVVRETLGPTERLEVERALRRLRPFTTFAQVARIDRATLESGKAPILVRRPLQVRRSEKGLRIAGVPHDEKNGEPYEALELPLDYDGSSFRLRVWLEARALPYKSGLDVRLATPGGDLGVSVGCGGGGNISTFSRTIGVGWASWDRPRIDSEVPIAVDIQYVEADALARVSVVQGDWRASRTVALEHALAKGESKLAIDLRPGCGVFDIDEIVVEAPSGKVRVRETAPGPLDDASRELVLGHPDRAAELCLGAGSRSSADAKQDAELVLAAALAGSGKEDEAAAQLGALPPARFAELVDGVAALGERFRVALGRAYARKQQADARALRSRGVELLERGKPREAAVAFLAAGSSAESATVEAWAWYYAGDPETALRLVERSDDPEARLVAGLSLHDLGMLEKALDKLEGIPVPERFLPHLRRLKRLLHR